MSVVGTPKSAEQIQQEWDTNPRWKDVTRTYSAEDVVALQGSVVEEHTLARRGAEVLWEQLHDLEWVNALGALTGNMAVQQVRAGLKASTCRAGRSPAMPTCPGTPTPTRACIPPTRCRRWSAGSTTHCSAPTRSPRSRAILRWRTGWRRLSPTARPALAARSTSTSCRKPDRRGRCGFALGGPVGL